MGSTPTPPPPPPTPTPHRSRTPLRLATVAGLATAGLLALPAGQALAASSTTVSPAGHAFTASLVSGTTADFVVGAVTVRCRTSSTAGQVPASPDNVNAAGPVSSVVSPPSFNNGGSACPTSVALTTATTTTNNTAGNWTIGLQYDAAGSTGTLTIPQAGVVTKTSGLASCTITVAPSGPVTIAGTWTPGTSTAAPRLDFSAGVTVPITVTGTFGCPTAATSATFRATYSVVDTTDSAQQITVTA